MAIAPWIYLSQTKENMVGGGDISLAVAFTLLGTALVVLVVLARSWAIPGRRWYAGTTAFVYGFSIYLAGCVFMHWTVSLSDVQAFNEPLNKLDALYFTLATFTTTGYGDIQAVSPAARAAVTFQMAMNFVVVGVGFALVIAYIGNKERAVYVPKWRRDDTASRGRSASKRWRGR